MRRERINVGQFQIGCPAVSGGKKIGNSKTNGTEGFLEIIQSLNLGMDEKEVAQRFCHESIEKVPNAKKLGSDDICAYLGGGSLGCASAANSAIKLPIPKYYSAYKIPLKDVRHLVSPTARSGGGVVMKDKGYDLNFVPIFEDGKLLVPLLEGTFVINGERRVFIWNLFGLGAQANMQVKKLL
jgi:hypothetical protein